GTLKQPQTFQLLQNYPNPFNPVTRIRYVLSRAATVELSVYDLMGRKVGLLAQGLKQAGTHEVIFNAGALASGIYFYKLLVPDGQSPREITRKMFLVK
ncbi:MAG TPA: T9SS type A sorting domain-containing protein, partial [Caldithrix abyssi]|nr:T9SS type A sorting domain-containing protein [Caldithrix abyssi]